LHHERGREGSAFAGPVEDLSENPGGGKGFAGIGKGISTLMWLS